MDNETNVPAVRPMQIGEKLCLDFRADLERALGYELISGSLAFGNFLMAVKEDVANSPKLRDAFQASPLSAISSLTFAAQCKLLPGAKYELFYLIPRSRKGVLEVSPMISYKGLVAMAQRHPAVHAVEAFLVYEGEEFEIDPGRGHVRHVWRHDVDRSDGKVVAGYAKATLRAPDGTPAVSAPLLWPMSIGEILSHRAHSDSWRWAESSGKRDSVWHLHFARMARKTLVRQLMAGGSVPRDMGMFGVLREDALADGGDAETQAAAPLPKVDGGAKARLIAGIDKEEPPFDFMEEAIQAIQGAADEAALKRLAPRWQHFVGGDAADIARAYEDRLEELQ